jgi:RND family efflux transporter MFP subunit
MRKLYMAALASVLAAAAAFIGYGVYLNRTSDVLVRTGLAREEASLYGARAEYRDITPMLVLDSVNFSPESMVDVMAETVGSLGKMFVAQGERVKKGQALCEITNPNIALDISIADSEISKARVSYAGAKAIYDMNKGLYSQNAISKTELDNSETQMKAALADVNASAAKRAELDRKKTKQTITSPIDGNVLLLYLRYVGDQVGEGEPVMLVGELSTLFFSKTVTEGEASMFVPPVRDTEYDVHIPPGEFLNRGFATDSGTASRDRGGSFKASVVSVRSPLAQADFPYRTVTWKLSNPHMDLGPNLYTNVTVRAKSQRRALCVPKEAIKGKDKAFIVEDGTLASREVKTGIYDDKYIEVTSGLSEGDTAVVSGVSHLRLGSKARVTMLDEE